MGLIEDQQQLAIQAAREVHGMWHAGASREDGLERLRKRCPVRPKWIFGRAVDKMFLDIWGPQACGPDHEIVICDDPAPV